MSKGNLLSFKHTSVSLLFIHIGWCCLYRFLEVFSCASSRNKGIVMNFSFLGAGLAIEILKEIVDLLTPKPVIILANLSLYLKLRQMSPCCYTNQMLIMISSCSQITVAASSSFLAVLAFSSISVLLCLSQLISDSSSSCLLSCLVL